MSVHLILYYYDKATVKCNYINIVLRKKFINQALKDILLRLCGIFIKPVLLYDSEGYT